MLRGVDQVAWSLAEISSCRVGQEEDEAKALGRPGGGSITFLCDPTVRNHEFGSFSGAGPAPTPP